MGAEYCGPGVVKRRLRHVWRFASVFSRPMDSRRLPTVPVDSSQAKRALAGQHHGVRRLDELVRVLLEAHLRRRGAAALRCCVENVFVGTSADAGALRAKARMADFIVDLRGRACARWWCKASRRARCAFFLSAAMAVDATGARIARFFGQRDAPSMSIAALGSGQVVACVACASRVRPLLATRCCSRRF